MSIVITGTPGVGKHTVAGSIAGTLGFPVVDINRVAKESGLAGRGSTADQVDVAKLGQLLKESLREPSLVVGHLAPYVLSPAQVKTVIVLRRDPYELLATYQDRGYSGRKGMENSGSEVLGVIFHDARGRFGSRVFQVRVEERSATVRKVLDVIRSGRGDEAVDWLELVTRNGDLRKFFSYE